MVELIPKPVEEAAPWQKILLYALVFFVVMLTAGYFALGGLRQQSQEYIGVLKQKIAQGETPEKLAMEEQSLDYKKKIERFYPFLKAHVLSSKFFDFLEERTHPRIFFSKLNLSLEDSKAILTGQTDSFLTLDQQVSLLNDDPLVEDMVLTTATLNKAGGIDFNMELFLDSSIFKY